MLDNILQTAVSGLEANAQSVASAADNIANASTIGYKRTETINHTLITQQVGAAQGAGGVQSTARQLADVQGVIAASTSSTDLAISGNGYFPVSREAQGGETLFTRDGSFAPDAQGNLVNSSGFFLQARETGNPSSPLSTVNVNVSTGSAQATTKISIAANLPAHGPAGANTGNVYTVSTNVTNSQGNSHTINVNFTAKAEGGYQLSIPNAKQNDSSGPDYSVSVVSNSDGLTSGFDADGDGSIDSSSPPGVYIAYSSSGAADLSIDLDLSAVTQLSGDFDVSSVQSDGAGYGSVTDIAVSTDGVIVASFDNGQTRAIAEIPVATFASPQNLQPVGGNTFRATDSSGEFTFDGGDAGTVHGGALERSTTDYGTEFASVIVAQSAYSASLKVVTTADDLTQDLLNVKG